jgi:hypothetical protein
VAIIFCACGRALRENETRCSACGRAAASRSSPDQHSNSASASDTVPGFHLQPVEVPAPPLPPRKRRSKADLLEDEAYRVLHEDDTPTEADREEQRRESRRLLKKAVKHLADDRRRNDWPLETFWWECLLYPVRALPLEFLLAAAWATLIAFVWLVLPDEWEPIDVVARMPLLLIVFLLSGWTVAFLQMTFTAASAGKSGFLAMPGRDLRKTARGGSQALLAFLAGPVVPVVVAWFFWLNSGDLEVIDWLILWELAFVAVVSWVLTLLATTESGRLRDANPLAVIDLVKRLGYRVVLAAVLMSLTLVGHGWLTLDALERLHRGAGGWMVLLGCSVVQLFWLVFLLRWLGVSSYRQQKTKVPSRAPGPMASASLPNGRRVDLPAE